MLAAWQRMLGDEKACDAALGRANAEARKINDESSRKMIETQASRLKPPPADERPGEPKEWPGEPLPRAKLLLNLAWKAHEAQDRDRFDRYATMAKAVAADPATPAVARDLIRQGMVAFYLRCADFEGAEAAAGEAATAADRAALYVQVAAARNDKLDTAGCRNAIAKAKEQALRVGTAKDLEAYPGQRCTALSAVAAAEASTGQHTAAAETLKLASEAASNVQGVRERVRALMELAQAQATAGDAAGCQASIALARQWDARLAAAGGKADAQIPQGVTDAAEALASAGKTEAAEQLAATVADPVLSSAVYAAVAARHASNGEMPRAIEGSKRITSAASKAAACRAIGEGFAKLKHLDRLEQWVGSLTSPAQRASACVGAAEGLLGRKIVDGREKRDGRAF
jgi:hypothetical protein